MVISSMRCLFHFLMPHFSFRSVLSFRELYQHEGSSSIDVSALVVKSTRREVDVKYGDKATTTGLLRDTHGRANPYRCNYQRLRCVELSVRLLAVVSRIFPKKTRAIDSHYQGFFYRRNGDATWKSCWVINSFSFFLSSFS